MLAADRKKRHIFSKQKSAPLFTSAEAGDKSAPSMAPIYRVAERPTEVPSGAGGLQKV